MTSPRSIALDRAAELRTLIREMKARRAAWEAIRASAQASGDTATRRQAADVRDALDEQLARLRAERDATAAAAATLDPTEPDDT